MANTLLEVVVALVAVDSAGAYGERAAEAPCPADRLCIMAAAAAAADDSGRTAPRPSGAVAERAGGGAAVLPASLRKGPLASCWGGVRGGIKGIRDMVMVMHIAFAYG